MAKSAALILGQMWKPQGLFEGCRIESQTRERGGHQAEGAGWVWSAQLFSSCTVNNDLSQGWSRTELWGQRE